jgi:Virulence factor
MAQRIIVYWRDIPAQIIIRQGRTAEKRELPPIFIQSIDRAAMRIGAKEADAYLAEWRKGAPEPCGDDLAAVADAEMARLVAEYDGERLKCLVEADGWDRPEGGA